MFVVLAVLLIVYGQNCECQIQNNGQCCGDSIQNNGQNNQNNVDTGVFNQVNECKPPPSCNQPCYEPRPCNKPRQVNDGGLMGNFCRGLGLSTC